jgi:hypothetical protein
LEEDDCSISSSDDDDGNDDDSVVVVVAIPVAADDANQVLMKEFYKLISKHINMGIFYALIKNSLTHMHC